MRNRVLRKVLMEMKRINPVILVMLAFAVLQGCGVNHPSAEEIIAKYCTTGEKLAIVSTIALSSEVNQWEGSYCDS